MTAEQAVAWMPTLLRPSVPLSIAIYNFFMTVLETIFVERRPLLLFNPFQIRDKSFVRFYSQMGPSMSVEMPGPTFQLLSKCRGEKLLDVGSGGGDMITHMNPNQITTVYCAEPTEGLHPDLRRKAQEAGFGSNLHILSCGAEPESLIPALHKSGILESSGKGGIMEDGVFDEICCIRVLCSVPHPQQTIKGLYNLLKPGGRMVVCEHVANPWRTEGRAAARFMQLVYTLLGWPFFLAGCEMQRHTLEYLRDAGEWDRFDLKYYGADMVVPFIVGEFIKKST